MAMNKRATTEKLLEVVFSVWSMQRPCSEGQWDKSVVCLQPSSKDVIMELEQSPLSEAVTKQWLLKT
jgi:hypothetical protein